MLSGTIKKTILICTLIVAITSCSNKPSETADLKTVPSIVMGSNEGLFRGFNLGDSLTVVRAKETQAPLEVDSGYLYYEYELPDSLGSFNITYNFDEKGLYEIQTNVFVTSASNTESILSSLRDSFDKFYGDSNQSDMGYSIWSVKSSKFGEVKINLSDESGDFASDNAQGKISLWFYKDDSNS